MTDSTHPADAGVVTDESVDSTPPVDRATPRETAVVPLGGAVQLTPDQWAEIFFPKTDTGRLHDDAWKHAAAAALHGWWRHEMVVGKPLVLDRDAYEGALAAASGNKFEPHDAALWTDPNAPKETR